jgi:hypothetical protein
VTVVCARCAETLVDPGLPCQFCIGERREQAVKVLVAAAKPTSSASAVARVDAIDTLRNLGHSQEEVIRARAKALDGGSVEEIVEGLVASERRVEVAA